MNCRKICPIIILLLLFVDGYSQRKFRLVKNANSQVVPFKLVNNLMVLSVNINGRELPFILDSGVDKTILFNVKIGDSIKLNNSEKMVLHGLGDGEPIDAIKSKNNLVKIKNIVNPHQLLYVLMGDQFDLSSKMGMDIYGIIGGDLFRGFIVKINYSTKKLIFYNPEGYEYKKCKDCLTLPLDFYRKKPLVDVSIENQFNEKIDVKLLVDSGGGDALWLFENTNPKITVSDKYFDDFLGKGLSGNIYGKRSLSKKLYIGNFELENVLTSYPDSVAIASAKDNIERNGTLGASILTRFHLIFDYPNKKITFKKNKSKYNAPFYYNKSGIEVVYGGDMLVQDKTMKSDRIDAKTAQSKSITQVFLTYSLAFKPSYKIALIRDDSPAQEAGLKVDDVFLRINGKTAFDLSLQEIVEMLSGRKDKKINLMIDRYGKQMRFKFELRNLL